LLPDTAVFIAGRQQPNSRRPKKRLAGYRVGAEGRISHLKRRYGLGRSGVLPGRVDRSGRWD
jgi:hypothetical protein